jgi:hypothetical protein
MNEKSQRLANLNLWSRLRGADRRSIGASNAVAAQVFQNTELFSSLILGMLEEDPVLRMRCADAAVKVSTQRPELLHPFKRMVLSRLSQIEQAEVRWHVIQIISLMKLTPHEKKYAVRILTAYLKDGSSIVKTFSMQALADLAAADPALQKKVLPLLKELTVSGTPAMRARGRKLLAQMVKHSTD